MTTINVNVRGWYCDFYKWNPLQFKYVFDIIDAFGEQSGFKVNLNEYNAYYVGLYRLTLFYSEFIMAKYAVKYLGVIIPLMDLNEQTLC